MMSFAGGTRHGSGQLAASDVFARNAWFASLATPQREALLSKANPRHYRDGACVYNVGDAPEGLHVVQSGEVRLISYPGQGKQVLGLILTPGDWFGEISFIDGGPRPHDAVCVGNSVVLCVANREVGKLTEADPGLFRHVALLCCAHQRAALARLELMTGYAAATRLIPSLWELSRSSCTEASPVVRVSQEELAGVVGVTRQRLNRLLQPLVHDRLIQLDYGRITILDQRRFASLLP
jgi:CRP-like cAMP-binding protein